jgi:hypothetical protein
MAMVESSEVLRHCTQAQHSGTDEAKSILHRSMYEQLQSSERGQPGKAPPAPFFYLEPFIIISLLGGGKDMSQVGLHMSFHSLILGSNLGSISEIRD